MKSNSRYMVSLHSMDIDGVSIKVSARSSTLLDSGTTFTYFPDTIYRPFSASIQKHCQTHKTCGQRQGSCYSGLGASPDLSGFPVVKMEFDGLSIDWNPSEYLYYTHDVWCDAFENDGHVARTTLGASFMLNKEVVFDLDASQIGMVAAACPVNLARSRPLGLAGLRSEEGATVISDGTSKNHSVTPTHVGRRFHNPFRLGADFRAAYSAGGPIRSTMWFKVWTLLVIAAMVALTCLALLGMRQARQLSIEEQQEYESMAAESAAMEHETPLRRSTAQSYSERSAVLLQGVQA